MNERQEDPKNSEDERKKRENALFFRFHYGENFCRVDTTKPCWREELTGRPVTPAINSTSQSAVEEDKKAE